MSKYETTDTVDDDFDTDAGDSVDGLKAALRREREARRKFEKDLKSLQSRMQEIEATTKEDFERLISERDELRELSKVQQEQIRSTAVQTSVREAAEAAGARNAKAVWKMVKDDIVVDGEKGDIKNLAEVLAAARAEAPEMFGAGGGKSDAGSKGGSPATVSMTDLIRQRAGFN